MNEQAWPQQWPDRALIDTFGAHTVERGRDYADHGHVGRIDIGGSATHPVMTATVRGTGFAGYRTVVVLTGDGRASTQCSCPVRTGCKHAVAVLITARRQAMRGAAPTWQQALQGLVSDAGASASAPLALEFSGTARGLRLRPLRPGRSSRWVRTGITWETISADHRGEYDRDQRLALIEVRRASNRQGYYGGYLSQSADLPLAETGHDVWAALRAARDHGVAFVAGPGTPAIRLADAAADAIVRLEPTPSGLRLHTEVSVTGAPAGSAMHVVGNPGHGVIVQGGDHLLLAPLGRPFTPPEQALLDRSVPLDVPEAEIGQFAARYLPMLRRGFDVRVAPGLHLPAPEPPVLTLHVTWRGDARADLTWRFRYRVGDHDTEVPAGDPGVDRALRDKDAERVLLDALPDGTWPRESSDKDSPPASDATLQGRDLLLFVSEALPTLQDAAGVEVTITGDLPAYRAAEEMPQVRVAVRESTHHRDWFNLDVDVTIDGETVVFSDLFRALATGEDHLVLDSGVWFDLNIAELDQLRDLIAEARSLEASEPDQLRVRVEHAGLFDDLVRLGVVGEQAARWREATRALLAPETVPDVAVPAGLQATLRPYQRAGLSWLRFLWTAGLGGVLADDMGLGKTLQVLALIASIASDGQLEAPVLVVAPTSVLDTWAAEAERFTPGLRVAVVTQTASKRAETLAAVAGDADIVVTSYTLLRLGEEEYGALDWSGVVLDEAQFVKNRSSKVYRAVRQLRAGVRFAITGTPLENNLMDLWSLLSITCPGLFPDPARFAETYRRPIENHTDPDALPRLRRRIRPVMLRRTKESVATELPPKQEQVLRVPLAPAHRRLYDRQLQAERKRVLGLVDDMTRNRIAILRSLTLLRQLALSPALVDAAEPAQSAKIDALVDLLTEISAEGHRALVFSQFTSFLALVRQRLDAEGIGHQYLDGRTRDRAERVQAFREGDDPAFLISLKAGGFGLTLTEADYVFVLDPWWNPAAELQAIDRTHRIGQHKHVMVYRMVSADTIEEKVVALQQRKRDLFADVVGGDADLAAPLRSDDIRALLEL